MKRVSVTVTEHLICLIIAAGMLALVCSILLGCQRPRPTYRILYFSAPWCKMCKCETELVKAYKREGGYIRTYNVDDVPDLVDHYRIDRVPCYVVITPLGGWSRAYNFRHALCLARRK